MVEYRVGDVIEQASFIGSRFVTVTERHCDVKNGRPGFDGTTSDGMRVWGYDSQVLRVYAR